MSKGKNIKFVCKKCGKTIIGPSYHRTRKYCDRECFLKTFGAKIKHGCYSKGKATKTYMIWASMKQRCENVKNKAYKNYGGRGIEVCTEWNKFEAFLNDMGEKPETLTLERKDNDKGYCRENCRWATRSDQMFNRRGYGSSKYFGISFHKSTGKWQASITIKDKSKYLGLFLSELDAAIAYNNYVLTNNLPNKLNKFEN